MKVTLIIDPDIFFQSYHGSYRLHPIITHWIQKIKTDASMDEFHIYLLNQTPGSPQIKINTEKKSFELPIGPVFFDMLSEDALEYIKELWQGKLQFADQSSAAPTGIWQYSDNYQVSKDEMIVVTANKEVSSFFKMRGIAVSELKSSCYPITNPDFEEIASHENVEIYCDFDGTLFDVEKLLLLSALKARDGDSDISPLQSELELVMSGSSDLRMINTDIVKLLLQLAKHPTYLLTQRALAVDKEQPCYNSAFKLVNCINSEYELNIQSSEMSYLNASEQMKDTSEIKSYIKKIEHIYWRIKTRSPESKPASILLIDDNPEEHAKVEMAKPYFEQLGVKISSVLVVNPIYFSDAYLASFKQYAPSLFEQLNMVFSSESDKLHSALLCVKEHQSEKAKIDEQESASALVSTSAKNKKDESYNIDNSHLLFSARDFLDEDDYPTTSFTNLCPLF